MVPAPPAPNLTSTPRLHLLLFLLLLLLPVACPFDSHPSQPLAATPQEDFDALHAALRLSGSLREAALQRLLPQMQRHGCASVLQAAALAFPPSHTLHMHAAFCSGAASFTHLSAALALQPTNAESIVAAAYHPSMQHVSQRLLRLLARVVPPPVRSGRQLYALAIAAATAGTFRHASHYFSLAVAGGVAVQDVGDSWSLALGDGGQPLRALQLLMMAGCCDGEGGGSEGGEGWRGGGGAGAWCAASAVNVGEYLVAHGLARHALLLLQCALQDGQVEAGVMALSCSARAHRALGNVAAALQQFTQALQLQPNSTDARRNAGMIMQEAGLLQQAEVHLRYCLEHNPHDATALSTMATVMAKTARLQQAEEMFLLAGQLQPDNSVIRTNIATYYRNNKLWAKAEAFAAQALARDPSACDMHAQLLQVHAQQAQPLPALHASASYMQCCSTGRVQCPDAQSALLSDIFFRRQMCDWSRWEQDVALLLRAAAGGIRFASFSALQASIFPAPPAVARAFARHQAAEFERLRPVMTSAAAAAAAGPQAAGAVLRIGFSFSDWFDHPVGDDALAAVAAAAAHAPAANQQPQTRVFCISPSVPLHAQPTNGSSHPCLHPPVRSLFLAENSTEVNSPPSPLICAPP
jgi:Flp pilus assembly protein TadD